MKIFVVGSINMDMVIETPRMPRNGETLTGSNFITNPGGKGANQAVACAKLGASTYMVGKVGNPFGDDLKKTLNDYGVHTNNVDKVSQVSSGVAVIVVENNDNRIILDKGTNALVDKDLIDEAFKNAEAGDILICQLEIPQETVKYAFTKAKEIGMKTIFNPAPAQELIPGILENADYFIPNQTECEFYTGILPSDEASSKEAILKLQEKGVKNTIITLGSDGSCTVIDSEYIKVDAFKVKALDTTAAGDTYVGAVAVGLSEGMSLKDAMTLGSKASSITVQRRGAQMSIPYRNEL